MSYDKGGSLKNKKRRKCEKKNKKKTRNYYYVHNGTIYAKDVDVLLNSM